MITSLAFLALAGSPVEPTIAKEQKFDKTEIISVVSKQIRAQIDNISTETLPEIATPTLIAENRESEVKDNKLVEALGDE